MRSSRTRNLIRKIAQDEDLTIKQVEEIVYSFFRFTSKSMGEGDRKNLVFDQIRLFKFGVFRVKPGRLNREKRIRKRFNEKNEKLARNRKGGSDNISGSIGNKGVQENLESGPFDEEGKSS